MAQDGTPTPEWLTTELDVSAEATLVWMKKHVNKKHPELREFASSPEYQIFALSMEI